jgi:alkaline phosphatase
MVNDPAGFRAQTVNLWFAGSNPVFHPRLVVSPHREPNNDNLESQSLNNYTCTYSITDSAAGYGPALVGVRISLGVLGFSSSGQSIRLIRGR